MERIDFFKSLLKTNWDEEFKNYLEKEKFTLDGDVTKNQKFFKLLDSHDLIQREICWKDLTIKGEYIYNIKETAHPYFIGFGNPNAEILIINKEKAIDIFNNTNGYFVKESINNYCEWRHKLEKNEDNFVVFPAGLERGQNKPTQTWSTCYTLIAGLYNLSSIEINQRKQVREEAAENGWKRFLMENCFITEINHLPSTQSPEKFVVASHRKKFLEDTDFTEFIRRFPIVIIGAISYFEEKKEETGKKKKRKNRQENLSVENLFALHNDSQPAEKLINKNMVKIYKSDKQKIFLTRQMSGANWNGERLQKLIEIIQTS